MARTPQMKIFPVVGWSYYQPMAHPLKAGKICPDISFYDDYLDDRSGISHGANDITASLGSYVVSPVSGTVWSNVQEGDEPDDLVYFQHGGWHVYVVGDDGFIYYCAHLLEKSPVSPGDRVEAGEFLGRVGRSGVVYGCSHLHFAVYKIVESGKGGSLNPYPYLRRLYQDNAAIYSVMTPYDAVFMSRSSRGTYFDPTPRYVEEKKTKSSAVAVVAILGAAVIAGAIVISWKSKEKKK